MITALIVAAGQGLRMGTDRPKQYLSLDGQAILVRTLRAFDRNARVRQIVLVIAQTETDFCRKQILAAADLNNAVKLVAGGRRRQDSVYNGLRSLDSPAERIVLIHDGVRPLVSQDLIDACIDGAMKWGACIPALPPVDTPKLVNDQGIIDSTVPRASLRMAQTPQAFRLDLILRAHAQARRSGLVATDDASLVEAMGMDVHVIAGRRENIKITTPEDLAVAEMLLKKYGI